MSVLLESANNERLSRASAPDYNAGPYTFAGLFYAVRNTGSQMNLCGIWADISNFDLVDITPAVSNSLHLTTAGGAATVEHFGSIIVPNTWYFIALVRVSATVIKVYLGTSPSSIALDIDETGNTSGRSAAAALGVGAIVSGFSTFDGRLRKWWISTDAKTLPQLQAIAASLTDPVTGAWAEWALAAHTDLSDVSGNTRPLTASGTLSTEADPPTDPWDTPTNRIVPNTTEDAGSWSVTGAATHHAALADSDAGSYVQSPANPSGEILKLGLSNTPAPGASDGLVFHIPSSQI